MILQQFDNLGTIERKVLGALIILADQNKIAYASLIDIADLIGYKKTGGALTFAIKILERDNYIVKIGQRKYKILI